MTNTGTRPAFYDRKARDAAITIPTLPGASLLHEGQFEGRRIKLPAFLVRRPPERWIRIYKDPQIGKKSPYDLNREGVTLTGEVFKNSSHSQP